ncbi:hypothetical protein DSM104329_04687 [Capillimicrobium parvum]|uniref:Large ribosomal subunit protein uL22 n=1 Tax=Capillimicrobium parvum TaxID=2884022 RepID=A0A9E7C378_9ACTN|nr:hypothetical protein DSM104329_04687 [Capillimicrobium parvum]
MAEDERKVEQPEVDVEAEAPVVDEPEAAEEAPVEAVEEAPVEAFEPVAEADEPVAEADEPVAEADEPVAEADEPVAEAEPEPEAPAATATATKPQPKPARADDDGRPPVVRAQAKYVRTSARKARLVCDHIRGKSVDEARAILAFTPRAVAKDWAKLLNSAVANAEHNHELLGEDLKVEAAFADEGPTLKRFQPRAMGRATRIRKRTSHLTITLTPKG